MTTQKYAGADWVASLKPTRPMSDLGRAAADLLGDVFLGIYHIDTKLFRQVDWSDEQCIFVPINSSLCTVDFDHLTRLMVLAHDRMLRVELKGRSRGWLSVGVWQRNSRTGSVWQRCPTLEEHAMQLRAHFNAEPQP